MMEHKHEDEYDGKLVIRDSMSYPAKAVVNTAGAVYVTAEEAPGVAQALLDAAHADSLVVQLPKTEFDGTYVRCRGLRQDINSTARVYSGELERTALSMLAVVRRVKAERGNRLLADERQLNERRNALLRELGSPRVYGDLKSEGPFRKAVDKIMELQNKENAK